MASVQMDVDQHPASGPAYRVVDRDHQTCPALGDQIALPVLYVQTVDNAHAPVQIPIPAQVHG
jgi:hypothetical protein